MCSIILLYIILLYVTCFLLSNIFTKYIFFTRTLGWCFDKFFSLIFFSYCSDFIIPWLRRCPSPPGSPNSSKTAFSLSMYFRFLYSFMNIPYKEYQNPEYLLCEAIWFFGAFRDIVNPSNNTPWRINWIFWESFWLSTFTPILDHWFPTLRYS